MKTAYTWAAAFIEEDGKYYAFAFRISHTENLVTTLARHNGLKAANLCSTKADAESIVNIWNEGFKQNGTYLFGDGPLF